MCLAAFAVQYRSVLSAPTTIKTSTLSKIAPQLVESSDGGGGWAADVAVSYRQPKPFESPFVVQPRQGMVEPRSDGAFKVSRFC